MSRTNMKSGSDLSTADAVQTVLKEAGFTMEEVELTADDDSSPVGRSLRTLQSALAALSEGKFSEVVKYFDEDGCFRFSDHALTLEFTDKQRLSEFFAKSRELFPEAISTLVASGQWRSSPYSGIIVHDFRGAATRVPIAATAFGLRKEHYLIEIIAAWEPTADDNGDNHREWARTLSEHLAPHALPGGYPNMLGPNDHEQTVHAFGANTGRLQQLKRRFDPDGVFSSAISLPLQKAA